MLKLRDEGYRTFNLGMASYADLARLPQADFEVDGRRYGVYYGHDWRAVPPAAWLQLLTEREIADGRSPTNTPSPPSLAPLAKRSLHPPCTMLPASFPGLA